MKKAIVLFSLILINSALLNAQVKVDTFFYTGTTQTFTITSNCAREVTIDITGGQGGDFNTAIGGSGGRVEGIMTFNVGDVLHLNVGKEGIDDANVSPGVFVGSGGVATFGIGTGEDSGTGGGGTDIRLNGTALSNRVIVAGGGGGAGGKKIDSKDGGDGGGLIGADGLASKAWPNSNGKGGTQLAGGAAGVGGSFCSGNATAGILGVGGQGAGNWDASGGGGGGGYYGGGGACHSSGGGGSSYASSSFTSVTHTQGFQKGDGMIILSYNAGPNQTIVACDSLVSPSGKFTWKTTGIYNDTISSTPGCSDTVLTIDLTVIPSTGSTEVVTACSYYIWPLTSNIYKSTGLYTTALTSINGCDSVITLDLTVVEPKTIIDSVDVCNTYTWPINGLTYTDNKNASITYTASNGCDSIRSLVLIIYKSDSLFETITACGSYLWPINGIEYSTSGMYLANFTNINGCDSIHSLDLTINPIDASVSRPGKKVLEANAVNAEYQWLDCQNNFAVLPADTNKRLIGEIGGNYAVMVTQNECIDTSNCISFYLGLEKNDFETEIKVYPNPTQGKMTIDLGQKFDYLKVELFDVIGKKVSSKTVYNQKQFEVIIEGESGEYFLSISGNNEKSAIIRIIKE